LKKKKYFTSQFFVVEFAYVAPEHVETHCKVFKTLNPVSQTQSFPLFTKINLKGVYTQESQSESSLQVVHSPIFIYKKDYFKKKK
jgi:hypothetical protein